jgi:hypothetical protein
MNLSFGTSQAMKKEGKNSWSIPDIREGHHHYFVVISL